MIEFVPALAAKFDFARRFDSPLLLNFGRAVIRLDVPFAQSHEIPREQASIIINHELKLIEHKHTLPLAVVLSSINKHNAKELQ